MAAFDGRLNGNEIFASLYNMIISQQVFAETVGSTSTRLVDMCRVDGGLYGDTKLYYATDVLASVEWNGDAESTNLLALDRPADPKVQKITLNKFRQIRLTVDRYLSKRAWGTEGAFASFNSVMLSWLDNTKKVYDYTLINSYIGLLANSALIPAEKEIDQALGTTEGDVRKFALDLASTISDILVDLNRPSREYNLTSTMRSWNPSEIVVLINSFYYNKITKEGMPTIFHDEIFKDVTFIPVPAIYFGTVQGTAHATVVGERATKEKKFNNKDYFPGDVLPTGTQVAANDTYIPQAQTINTADQIVGYVTTRDFLPYMSAFEVATEFYNPRSLTENHYLTFGHNDLVPLEDRPLIEIKTA